MLQNALLAHASRAPLIILACERRGGDQTSISFRPAKRAYCNWRKIKIGAFHQYHRRSSYSNSGQFKT